MAQLKLGGSRIENIAQRAIERSDLGSFNLIAARKDLTGLLGAIGRTAEFSTYTSHDITHIDALLAGTDWIIPESTFEKLTVADALVITLAIYVHDLGMLVTKEEFRSRDSSHFPDFKAEVFADMSSRGIDLRDRLGSLPDEDQEHFLYEEFVRSNHAERVEGWVIGRQQKHLGIATEAETLVSKVFEPLDPVIRADVALVARSHHLDDLDDLSKYKVNRSYGADREDTANLQYAALVLRTADLLHMTRDRTPSIQFRLASPADPLGQREWQKQRAVRAVKARPAAEGLPDTVEIHARFDNAEGFFALMEYVDYCEEQLIASSNWAAHAARTLAASSIYEFNWSKVDREQIEAEGFDRRQFQFHFDQERVLELLTGHTLYNDAGVAVRELLQNSIDSVRLNKSRGVPMQSGEPDIRVSYDSKIRTLRILDHGTGMSQETIEQHFLKVGSSSYQTKEFLEANPTFTSISRFGIGVLSAFMIADEVKVATLTSGERTGRELQLKSVHGRYLIKNFDSDSDFAHRIGEHGTEIELRLRASTDLRDSILGLIRRWILLPGCSVEYVGDEGSVAIGSATVQQSLESLLEPETGQKQTTRVITFQDTGIDIAIAQVWNETFKEWDNLRVGRNAADFGGASTGSSREVLAIAGVSVQGVRVTSYLPGFRDDSPVMLVNVSGADAPKTNVARSDLEAGAALDSLTRAIYSALLFSIESQVPDMVKRITLRLALKEASLIYLAAVSNPPSLFTKSALLRDVLNDAPVHPVEVDGKLEARRINDLRASGFSLLIGPASDDAARFLDWLPRPKGLLSLLQEGGLLGGETTDTRPLLAGQSALFAYGSVLWDEFEPSSLRLLERGTSLFLSFDEKSERWANVKQFSTEFRTHFRSLNALFERRDRFGRAPSPNGSWFCVDKSVATPGLEAVDVVFVGGNRLFLPHSKMSIVASKILSRLPDATDRTVTEELAPLLLMAATVNSYGMEEEEQQEFVDLVSGWLKAPERSHLVERDQLVDLAQSLRDIRRWTSSGALQRRGDTSE